MRHCLNCGDETHYSDGFCSDACEAQYEGDLDEDDDLDDFYEEDDL